MKKNLYYLALLFLTASLHAENITVKPTTAIGIAFADGIVGKCARFDEKSRLCLDSAYFNSAGGCVEMWICPALRPADQHQVFFISMGSNNPSWFCWGYGASFINFLSCSKLPNGKFSHYSSMKMNNEFTLGEWTHIALNWCNMGQGKSMVQLYVNGEVIFEKFDQSLDEGNNRSVKNFSIGCNSARAASPSFIGLIDEIRISNQPLTPEKIAGNYRLTKDKRDIPVDETTILKLSFEDTLDGQSSSGVLDLRQLIEKGNRVLDVIVGK